MPRHPHGPLSYIDKNVGIQCYHDNKSHQVKHCPEDQVGVAIKRSHVGTGFKATDTVPPQAGNRPHDYGHGPDYDDHHYHTLVAHACVELHPKDGDVALDGDGQQVGHGCSQARVNQALTQQPCRNSQMLGVWSCVKHQVEVRQSSKEISSCQVGHQVVDREVKSPVDIDGDHYQKVGEHDEDAHRNAQAHHETAHGIPVTGEVFTTVVVEESDSLIVVTLILIHGGNGIFCN